LKYPCEKVTKYFLPAYRSLIAKALIENYGFTQVEAANKLGTTQAAISHYISSKRGEKYVKELQNNPKVRSTINKVVKELALKTTSPEEVMPKLCDLCLSIRDTEIICNMS
jgi:hypothetical protein